MQLVVIKDTKADLYLQPNFQRTVADAMRSLEQVANAQDGNTVALYPNDFRLIHLGSFDPLTGKVTLLDVKADLGSAADFKRPAPQPALPFTQPN